MCLSHSAHSVFSLVEPLNSSLFCMYKTLFYYFHYSLHTKAHLYLEGTFFNLKAKHSEPDKTFRNILQRSPISHLTVLSQVLVPGNPKILNGIVCFKNFRSFYSRLNKVLRRRDRREKRFIFTNCLRTQLSKWLPIEQIFQHHKLPLFD